jgi:LacI family transcriptional regulator
VPDEEDGARKAIDHLLALGRRRIAHVTGPERHHSAAVRATAAGDRLRAAAGIELAGGPMYGEWSEAWGRQAASMLLTAEPELDAVFAGSDQIARGVADALRAAGRRIPEEVALVGFDNWDVMALGCQPPLTSLDMDLEGLGRVAAELLLEAINGKPTHGRRVLPCRLVVRASTVA